MSPLQFEEKIIGNKPTAAVIWLHGLGADGFDFIPIPEQLALPADLSVRFIFPHAPVQAVTLNQGMQMNSWYDISQLSMTTKEDRDGIFAAMNAVEALINAQCQNIHPSKIILAGFSQGGAVALHTLLHGKVEIGGVIALSTYLPLRDLVKQADTQRAKKIPLFMAHGLFDEILAYEVGEMSKTLLVETGVEVDWHAYPMAHSLCVEEIKAIGQWLAQKLK
jgi:phospholipase/carboxylesterase